MVLLCAEKSLSGGCKLMFLSELRHVFFEMFGGFRRLGSEEIPVVHCAGHRFSLSPKSDAFCDTLHFYKRTMLDVYGATRAL
jgi:hypothetical protein